MSNNFDLYDYYEHLVLKDGSGIVVDSAWHGNYFGDNVSMIRDYDNLGDAWIPSNWMTPGDAEPGTEPYVSVDVIFSEILPDGEGLDTQSWPLGEWLELYNNDTMAVDLTGWKLKASNSRSFTLGGYNFPFQPDAIIQPGNVGLIALNGTNSFYLKGTTDIITLVDAVGGIVDTVGWNFTLENTSLVAPGTSHAGYTTANPAGITGWIEPAWATPNQVNPVWPAYTGSNELIMTEYSGWCDESGNNHDDWIEIYNNGTTPIDLSRWRIDTDNKRHFITSLATVDGMNQNVVGSDDSISTILNLAKKYSVPEKFIKFHGGWFSKTCNKQYAKENSLKKASIIWLDCDLYSSAKDALNIFDSILQNGTIIVVDDWYNFKGHPKRGVQKAFNDWRFSEEISKKYIIHEYKKDSWSRNSFIVNLNDE